MIIPAEHYSADIISKFQDGIRNVMALSSVCNVPIAPLVAASFTRGFRLIQALTEVADETLKIRGEVADF
jgi:hypothetical protein